MAPNVRAGAGAGSPLGVWHVRLFALLVLALPLGGGWGCGQSRGSGADAGTGGRAGGQGDRDGNIDGTGGIDGGTDAIVRTGIVVNTPSGRLATETEDGYCDLLEAIEAANTDRAVHECPPGHGVDRIILAAGASYPTVKTLRLTTDLTIGTAEGGGDKATISAAEGFQTDATDRWSSCLVYAPTPATSVKLADVTLSQSPALSVSGACVTSGMFEIRRGRVTGFRQGGLSGYCLPELGCDHETGDGSTSVLVLNSLVDGNYSPRNGGGIFSEGSGMTLAVVHSAVVNNVSEQSGGGAYFGGGWSTHRIAQSTVSGNRAAAGGGVMVNFTRCTATYLYVMNSTVANNSSTSTGGGIEFKATTDCYSQDVTVLGSIVTNNTAEIAAQSNINDDWTGGQFNCDRGSLLYVAPGLHLPSGAVGTPCRFDVADALLGPLMPMGGAGNLPLHPLRRGSPAIDAAIDDRADDQQRDSWSSLYDPPLPPPWMVFDRVVDGDGDGVAARDLGAHELNDVWQTELLAVAAKGPAPHAVVTTPTGYNREGGTSYGATTATGQFVTYVVPIAETGTYSVAVGVRQANDGGQFQLAVADSAAGPWTNLGAVQDTHAPSSAFVELNVANSHSFASAGQKLVRFTVVGKNAASSGYQLLLDYVTIKKLP